MSYDSLRDIKFQNYRNSSEVMNVAGVSLTVEDMIKAALVAKLNVYLIGETGNGKTQLENDILGLFGNNGFFEQGRNDLEIRDMFTRLNLDKLSRGGAKTTEDIKELTGNIKHPVYVVDELTRCIPAVQNQFFNLFDGFITIDGVRYQLGTGNYCVGVASGNVGNGRYVGVSETDRALLDRMHLIIDLDNFDTTATDDCCVLTSKKDPRVSHAEPADMTGRITAAHNELCERDGETALINYVASVYLRKGLDWLDDVPGNSKRKVKNKWPQVVQSHGKGGDEALIFPISMRAAISYLRLSQAIEAVAQSKGAEIKDHLAAFLDTFAVAGAYSGILDPMWVDQEHYGNPYSAMKAIVEGIKAEMKTKEGLIAEGIAAAQEGKLEEMISDQFTGRWGFMKSILEDMAKQAREDSSK